MSRYQELSTILGTKPTKEEMAEIIYVKELELQTLYGVLDKLGVVLKSNVDSESKDT
jgi:hypothetical protein